MRPIRKFSRMVLAVAIPLGILVSLSSGGEAWAKVAPGTVSCTTLTAKITFAPPLVPGTATSSSEKVTIKPLKLAGCTSSTGAAVPNPAVVAKVIKNTSNSCSVFAGNLASDTVAFTAKWKASVGVPSKATFLPGHVSLGGTGFTATGGTVTGSFKTTSATFSVTVAPTDLTKLTTCIGGSGTGVSAITIVSGSSTL
jgi:hypothetical protein